MRSIAYGLMLSTALLVAPVSAAAGGSIDADVAASLAELRARAPAEVKKYLGSAKGVLVFPKVIKAGIGIGGEYGKGALLVGGRRVDYYSVAGASIGLQLGAQERSQVILFMTNDALNAFRKSKGWKAGVDGSVAVIKYGAGGELLTPDVDTQAVIGVIYGARGLMYNLSFEGQKFSKIKG